MSHEALVSLVTDENGTRAVVTYADEVIWIADELWAHVRDPNRKRIRGDLEVDGDRLVFGTAGEGLGRLQYRLVGRDEANGWHIARREEV